MLRKIERQLNRGLRLLAPEDQWLLEIDRKELLGSSLRHQQHWLWSIEAACEAGARAEKLTKGQTTSWKEILKDENFAHLPTTAPKKDTAAVGSATRSQYSTINKAGNGAHQSNKDKRLRSKARQDSLNVFP